MKVRDIEIGGIVNIEGQVAERASNELFRTCWGYDPPEGEVPFVILLPDDKLDWYGVPEDSECEREEDADAWIMRN